MKAVWFFPPALLVVVALFMFMAQLANPGTRYLAKAEQTLDLNMLRMRFDSDVQLRERELPPPPEEIPQPQSVEPAVSSPMPNIDLPQLDIPDVSLDATMNFQVAPPSLPTIVPPTDLANTVQLEMGQVPKKRINPQYPRRALQRKVEGYVVVEFKVNEQGQVDTSSLVFVESQPQGVFERTVRKSVARWRYHPLMRGGQAVAYKTRQRFEFNLDK